MLGPIKRLLGPIKARLQGYIKKAKTILERAVDEINLDREETELDDLIHQFSSNITLLERCNQEWTTLVNVMESGNDKDTKEKGVSVGYRRWWKFNGIAFRLQGDDCVFWSSPSTRFEEGWKGSHATFDLTAVDNGNLTESQTATSVKMKLNLPTFDGDILQWQEFWDVYKSAQELSNLTTWKAQFVGQLPLQ